jgi:hypothetical protein
MTTTFGYGASGSSPPDETCEALSPHGRRCDQPAGHIPDHTARYHVEGKPAPDFEIWDNPEGEAIIAQRQRARRGPTRAENAAARRTMERIVNATRAANGQPPVQAPPPTPGLNRAEALAANDGAYSEWIAAAVSVFRRVAERMLYFTSDDVLDELDRLVPGHQNTISPENNMRVVGNAVTEATRQDIITAKWPSENPDHPEGAMIRVEARSRRNNGNNTVYRSLLHGSDT